MKKEIKIIIAIVSAITCALVIAILATRGQLKATDSADADYDLTMDTVESVEEVQINTKDGSYIPPETVERTVVVTTNLDDAEYIKFGMEYILTATLSGFDGLDYEIRWQRSLDLQNWETVEGAVGEQYSFILSEENYQYYWRADVVVNE